MCEPVAADAAGQRRHTAAFEHHAAITTGESKYRKQTRRQLRTLVISLERQQIVATVTKAPRALATQPCCSRQAFPRAVRIDDDTRQQAGAIGSIGPVQCDLPVARNALDRLYRPRLQGEGTGGAGRIAQQRIQRFTSQCTAPAWSVVGFSGCRQVGEQRAFAAHQRYPPQCGAGSGSKGRADAERGKQRQVAGSDAFAAHLAAWKITFLDQRHRPAGAREQDRRRRSGRAGADNSDVKTTGAAKLVRMGEYHAASRWATKQ